MLIFNSLFAKETINLNLLLFSVVSFIGITLVVDSTVFGLGVADDNSIPNTEAGIDYMTTEAFGVMFCFVYVFANSVSKVMETHLGRHTSSRQLFEQKSDLCLYRDVCSYQFKLCAHGKAILPHGR